MRYSESTERVKYHVLTEQEREDTVEVFTCEQKRKMSECRLKENKIIKCQHTKVKKL